MYSMKKALAFTVFSALVGSQSYAAEDENYACILQSKLDEAETLKEVSKAIFYFTTSGDKAKFGSRENTTLDDEFDLVVDQYGLAVFDKNLVRLDDFSTERLEDVPETNGEEYYFFADRIVLDKGSLILTYIPVSNFYNSSQYPSSPLRLPKLITFTCYSASG